MSCEQSLSNHSSCVLAGWFPEKKNSRAYVSAGVSSICILCVQVCANVCDFACPLFILMKSILFHFLMLSGKQTRARLIRRSPMESGNVRLRNASGLCLGRFF